MKCKNDWCKSSHDFGCYGGNTKCIENHFLAENLQDVSDIGNYCIPYTFY